MGDVLVGIASWQDRSLVASGLFYPPDARTPEEQLRYYAARFPLVEVDSSYYAVPARRTAALWAERTPDGFRFDVKAFRLLTEHPTPLDAVPRDLRPAIPARAREKRNLYRKDVPPEVQDRLWQEMAETLVPLHSSGRLGAVLFQFPPWYHPSPEHLDYLLECRRRLPDYRIAVEFRRASWLSDRWLPDVTAAFRDARITLVTVDMPHDVPNAVPLVLDVTNPDLAYVRMHGHNAANWSRPGATLSRRRDYLYTDEELRRWAGRIHRLAERAREVHVILTTQSKDYAPRNAARLRAALQKSPHPAGETVR